MKKRAFLILALISIVAMLAGTAASPMASRSIKLLDTRFIPGKGVVFLFETTGVFTKSDMDTAFAYASGNSLDVDCKVKKNLDQIACTVALVNQYAGQQIVVGLLGQGFWTEVPAQFKCYGFSFTEDFGDGISYNVTLPHENFDISEFVNGYGWFGPLTNLNRCIKEKWDGYPNVIENLVP